MKRLLLLASIIWLAVAAAVGAPAINCSGVVVDAENEPIIGATVLVPGTKAATATNIDGKFTLKVPENGKEIRISFIGYKTAVLKPAADMGTIVLEQETLMLNDVVVTQSVGKNRETPVAMSTIDAAAIEYKLGNQELLEVLKTTPGVYTRSEGGGFGDAKTRMRGFDSPNVAMLINGIPVNDMEWGGVYMSNWANLSDVASSIQTQRGLGATMISTPSIGGTINIITRTIDAERGGSLWYGTGNDGLNNIGLKFSTGLMKNGWAITLLGSRKWADGYIQGTAYESYSYFLNITKRFNEKHQLGLTAFGAPQWHDQRNYRNGLTVEGWQSVKDYMDGESPYRFNPTYGFRKDGTMYNSSHNEYHKPQIALNHIWQIDNTSSLSSSVYMSITSGGGRSGYGRTVTNPDGTTKSYSSAWYGATNGVLNNTFRTAEGWVDYGAIEDMNAASTTGSNMVMTMSNNSHQTYGLISSYKKAFNFNNGDKLNIIGGIDMRYYVAHHNNEITDLFGGEYYMDDYNRNQVKPSMRKIYNNENKAWLYEHLHVGDKVGRNYDGFTAQEGLYAQAEYTMLDNKLNLVLAGSFNNNTYWRKELFYADPENARSATKNFVAGSVKGGANYNIDRHNNVFFNAGYISRAPYFSGGVFLSAQRSNLTNPHSKNEKVGSIELGYGYHSPILAINVNAYFTKWMDRTMSKGQNLPDTNNGTNAYYFNMNGVDARHMGVEIAAKYKPTKWMEVDAMLSLGDWQWDSNATGYFYNQNGDPLKSISGSTAGELASGIMAPDHLYATLDQKGVKVSGSAQTTTALGVTFRPFEGFRIGADWTAYFRNYSDIDLDVDDLKNNGVLFAGNPWRIPWGNQLDLSASYRFKIGGVKATVFGNVNNLCNYNYVTQAETPLGADGTWKNAYSVFYSFGRTYSIKLKIDF